jgi:hypothetical protein
MLSALPLRVQAAPPDGTAEFVAERILGRAIARRAPGPKPKRRQAHQPQLL